MSSMGTNIKINNFGTLPGTSASVNTKNNSQHFISMTISTNIINYFVSKIKTKSRAIFETKQLCNFVQFTNSCFCYDFITKLFTHNHTFRISRFVRIKHNYRITIKNNMDWTTIQLLKLIKI